jgi:hypothetical protein
MIRDRAKTSMTMLDEEGVRLDTSLQKIITVLDRLQAMGQLFIGDLIVSQPQPIAVLGFETWSHSKCYEEKHKKLGAHGILFDLIFLTMPKLQSRHLSNCTLKNAFHQTLPMLSVQIKREVRVFGDMV